MTSPLTLPLYILILLTDFENLIVLFPHLSVNGSYYMQFTERFLVEWEHKRRRVTHREYELAQSCTADVMGS
jgi:hypothetical protein